MIDLSVEPAASPLTQTALIDPGASWVKDHAVAIDAPPDEDTDPRPDAGWSQNAKRSGLCGAVSPRVVTLSGGGYRMYYTQILPRPGFPAGANDYENATTRILSATSPDGFAWTPEPGVRLAPRLEQGELRVVSSEVVPTPDGWLRMYYESANGLQSDPSAIHSAVSEDSGLTWNREPGVRLASGDCNYGAPRILFLTDGRVRLYCYERGLGIISSVSNDEGLSFCQEPGIRIAQGGIYDALTAFAPEIMRLDDGTLIVYYAGYSVRNRAYVLRATSEDEGLTWRKEAEPVLSPGGMWDGAKCSEMCVFRLSDGTDRTPRYRMVYEACDGTANDERGVWRIASATSA